MNKDRREIIQDHDVVAIWPNRKGFYLDLLPRKKEGESIRRIDYGTNKFQLPIFRILVQANSNWPIIEEVCDPDEVRNFISAIENTPKQDKQTYKLLEQGKRIAERVLKILTEQL